MQPISVLKLFLLYKCTRILIKNVQKSTCPVGNWFIQTKLHTGQIPDINSQSVLNKTLSVG